MSNRPERPSPTTAAAAPLPPSDGDGVSNRPDRADGAPDADPLAELAAARGAPVAGGANRPIHLSDPGVVCYVAEGSVDVFAARRRADGVPTDFKHLLRAGTGRLLFPAAEGLTGTVLVAKGLPSSALRLMPLDALDGAGCDEQVVEQVEAWVAEVSEAVTREFTFRPRIDHLLSAERPEQAVEAGQTLSARRGVAWVSAGDASPAYLGTEEGEPDGPGVIPVTAASWVTLSERATVRRVATSELHREGRALPALAAFNDLALSADDLNRRLLLADVANLRTSTAEYRRRGEQTARRRLFEVLDPGGAATRRRAGSPGGAAPGRPSRGHRFPHAPRRGAAPGTRRRVAVAGRRPDGLGSPHETGRPAPGAALVAGRQRRHARHPHRRRRAGRPAPGPPGALPDGGARVRPSPAGQRPPGRVAGAGGLLLLLPAARRRPGRRPAAVEAGLPPDGGRRGPDGRGRAARGAWPCWFQRCCWEPSPVRRCPPAPCECWPR